MRRMLTLSVVLVFAGLLSAGDAALGASALASPGGTGGFARGHRGAYFAVGCRFSHRNQDDAIVFPGQPGRSHDHTYFGSVSTNAATTVDSLEASGTTCRIASDRSAYWVPTLMVENRPVEPIGAVVYYVRRTRNAVEPFPRGFRMIAGDATARTPQSSLVTSWTCGGGGVGVSSVPSCSRGLASLTLRVRFPDCWDGRQLDSADHKSHVAYSSAGACPASHPVAMPGLLLIVRYPTAGGSNTELSSGGQFSGHGDFFNAWNQQVLSALVSRRLNRFAAPAPVIVI